MERKKEWKKELEKNYNAIKATHPDTIYGRRRLSTAPELGEEHCNTRCSRHNKYTK